MRGVSLVLIIFSFLIQVVVTQMYVELMMSTLLYLYYTSAKDLSKEVGNKEVLHSSCLLPAFLKLTCCLLLPHHSGWLLPLQTLLLHFLPKEMDWKGRSEGVSFGEILLPIMKGSPSGNFCLHITGLNITLSQVFTFQPLYQKDIRNGFWGANLNYLYTLRRNLTTMVILVMMSVCNVKGRSRTQRT